MRNLSRAANLVVILGFVCGSIAVRGGSFVAPYSGTLYMQCVGGSAAATSEFGAGTSSSNFVPYLTGLPSSCPDAEVQVGSVSEGQTVQFGISTAWQGQTYWAFSSGTDPGSVVAFTDVCNSLGMGGSILQQTSSTTWVMHLNDAAHYTINQCEANNILIQLRLAVTPPVQTVLPQFVFGGGWYSALYFTNTGTSAVSFAVNFVADSGTPLFVPSIGGSFTTVKLAAQATAIIEAPNSGPLSQGYVSLSLPSGVVGYGVFRQSVPGIADQEAVVPFSSASATTNTLTWDDTSFTTTAAIANPSSQATAVLISAWDSSGHMIGISSVALSANGKTEVMLRNLPGLSGVAGNRGSASFTVSFGNVAVLGLRFNGAAFTSIPTSQN